MVALAQVLAWSHLCGSPCQLITLDLPPGNMFDQVLVVALKGHIEWLFDYAEVNPKTPVPALRGTFTVNEALRRIFEHTPYTYEFLPPVPNSRFFFVSPYHVCGKPWHGYVPIPPCIRQVRQ